MANFSLERIFTSARSIVVMGCYLFCFIRFSSYMSQPQRNIIMMLMMILCGIFNLVSAYVLLRREDDEEKEGHHVYTIVRRPLEFRI